MDKAKEKRRWPLTIIVIVTVIIASVAMIYIYRDAPGRIPVQAISDGSNGVIVIWHDEDGIYAQRVGPLGQPEWEMGGVFICKCPSGSGFTLTPDRRGGAIITWTIPFYCQRISAGGEPVWGDFNAIPAFRGTERRVVPDGNGDAIVAWNDYKTYC